jgi:hypothetical protein
MNQVIPASIAVLAVLLVAGLLVHAVRASKTITLAIGPLKVTFRMRNP